MKLLKFSILSFILLIAGIIPISAVPPYMWYATHTINLYNLAGCNDVLTTSHLEGDQFHNALQSKGINNSWRRYTRKDTACTPIRWTGPSAEINGVDFLFFSGHGCGKGPILGCSPSYQLKCWESMRLGGYYYLKWVHGSCCFWFSNKLVDTCCEGKDEFQRWGECFKGVHAIQGHRYVTVEKIRYDSLSKEFWDRWIDYGNTIYNAWKYANIHWIYEVGGIHGLQPATAAANENYANELWVNAGDELAPHGMGWLGWTTVGNPQY